MPDPAVIITDIISTIIEPIMEPRQTPPPLPYRPVHSIGFKFAIIVLLCTASVIVSVIFHAAIYNSNRHKQTIGEMLMEYGDDVNINGPILYTDTAAIYDLNDRPETFVCDVSVDSKRIRRNVHEVEAFKAHVAMSGTIDRHTLEVPVVDPDLIGKVPDSAVYKTNVLILMLDTDPRQVSGLTSLTIGGKTVEWECAGSYFTAQVNITDMPEIIEYSTEFNVRGTGSIYINQAGRKSDITIKGTSESTSFAREHRPEEYTAADGRFTARWSDTSNFTEQSFFIGTNYAGIDFPLGVGQSRKLSRSLKSSFVLFAMVLLFVLSTEVTLRRDIKLLSYCLITCSLALFLILLLILSESMIFGIAYLIASLLIITLIAFYLHRLTGSKKTAIITVCALAVLFLCNYIMLSLTTFSSLMATLLLLVSLITTMFIITEKPHR